MGDRQDSHDFAAVIRSCRQYYRARPILDAFFLSPRMVGSPQIAVADDETLNRFREWRADYDPTS